VDGKTYIGTVDTGGILKKEGRQDLAIAAYQGIKSVAIARLYIAAAPGGDASTPVYLPVEIDLVPANWEDLLDAINAAKEYVALDLSACPMHGTEFDPGTNATGESKIVSLVLPDAAVSIKEGNYENATTFKNFTGLKNISGVNVKTVDGWTFIECPDLTEVSFPAATSIGNGAFRDCKALTDVELPAATSIGDFAFYECTALTSVELPAATSIGSKAFYECTALTSVELPAATSIGDSAYYYCLALTSVNLPAATSIGNAAFCYCAKLTNVYLGGAVPSLGCRIFYNVSSLTVHVRVPAGASAWADQTGTFTGDDSSGKWGNGFRGAGWNGSGFVDDGYGGSDNINDNITVTITDSQ
jgi:hypothetical protein